MLHVHEINAHNNVALSLHDAHYRRISAAQSAHENAAPGAHEFNAHSDVALNTYGVCMPHEHRHPYGYSGHDVHTAQNTRAHAPQNYPDHAPFAQHHPTFADYLNEAQDTRVFPRKSLLSPNSVRVQNDVMRLHSDIHSLRPLVRPPGIDDASSQYLVTNGVTHPPFLEAYKHSQNLGRCDSVGGSAHNPPPSPQIPPS